MYSKIIEKFEKYLRPVNTAKYKQCRIKWRGEFIELGSGKRVWNMESHAKSAFKNHISTYSRSWDYQSPEYKILRHNYSEFIKYLTDNKNTRVCGHSVKDLGHYED